MNFNVSIHYCCRTSLRLHCLLGLTFQLSYTRRPVASPTTKPLNAQFNYWRTFDELRHYIDMSV